jgi:hypothetical protein
MAFSLENDTSAIQAAKKIINEMTCTGLSRNSAII